MGKRKDEINVQSNDVVLQPIATLQPRITGNAVGLSVSGDTVEKGDYVLAALDKEGNEIPNSEFKYPAGARFNKTFANNPNFIIKKKP